MEILKPSIVGTVLVVSSVLLAVFWLVLEGLTLMDKIPRNHITAVVRRAFAAEPGVFVGLAWVIGYICGHLFWSACP